MKKYILSLMLVAGGFAAARAQSETTAFDVDGIKVIFKPTLKEIVNVRLYFRAGVFNYPASKAGIETFAIQSTTECGTQKHPGQSFSDLADKYGILIGGSSAQDYGYTQLNCTTKYFNTGWDLFTEAIMTPAFSPAEVQLLRDRLITQSNGAQSSPDARIDRLVIQNGFEGTPYATDPDGSEETLSPLTIDELKTYYNSILNKNQVFLVVVGKIDKDELIAKVKASFAAMPSRPYTPPVYPQPAFNDNKLLVENRELSTNYIAAIMPAPKYTDDYYVPFKLGVTAFSGLLFNQLRSNMHLSYDQGARVETLQMPYTEMYVSTQRAADAVEAMANIVKRIKSITLSERALREMKSGYITSNYTKQQSSVALTEGLGLAEILGGWQLEENLPENIDRVTTAAINNAFNQYLTGLRWSYLGNPAQATEAAAAFKLKVN